MSNMSTTEYGVMHRDLDGLHRGPMPREEAEEWIRDAVDAGFAPGTWVLATRDVSEWRVASSATGGPQ